MKDNQPVEQQSVIEPQDRNSLDRSIFIEGAQFSHALTIQVIENRIAELDLSDYADTVRAYELNRLIKELKNEGKSN